MSTTAALDMREKILETATRLFVAHGYDGISMREIAEACGLSKAGLYYHFKDKEDLFLAILYISLDDLDTITQFAASEPGGAKDKLCCFVRAIFNRLPADRRDVIRLANSEMGKISEENRRVFAGQYQEKFIGPVQAILEQGMAAGELRSMNASLAVWGLLGLMYPFFNPAHLGVQSMDGVVDLILAIFFEGVAVE